MTTLTEPGTTPRVDPLGPPGSHRFTPVGDEAFHVKRPRWARPALAVLLTGHQVAIRRWRRTYAPSNAKEIMGAWVYWPSSF